MKRYIAIILLITAFVALTINYGSVRDFVKKHLDPTNSVAKEDVTKKSVENTPDSFTVFVESGEVLYGNGTDYTTIESEEMILPNSTFIQTKKGTAQVILANNSVITLDENTEIQVNSENKKTTIVQLYGNTWHRVKSIFEIGDYEVKTDNTIAAVRGTVFSVNIDENGSTDVHVVEHTVEVTKGEEIEGKWVDQEVNLIEEGKQARVLARKVEDKKMEVKQSDAEFRNSEWFTENRIKDELLQFNKKEDIKSFMREKIKQRRDAKNQRQSELNNGGNQNKPDKKKDENENSDSDVDDNEEDGDGSESSDDNNDSDDNGNSGGNGNGNSGGNGNGNSGGNGNGNNADESDNIEEANESSNGNGNGNSGGNGNGNNGNNGVGNGNGNSAGNGNNAGNGNGNNNANPNAIENANPNSGLN